MVSYTPLSTDRQNLVAGDLARTLKTIPDDQLGEYFTHGLLFDVMPRINQVKSKNLFTLRKELLASHGQAGVGALGTIITTALTRAVGAPTVIDPRGADFHLGQGTFEQKANLRPIEGGRINHFMVNFSLVQVAVPPATRLTFLGMDLVDAQTMRPFMVNAPTSVVSELWRASRQHDKGTFALGLPVNGAGTFSTRGKVGWALRAHVKDSIAAYRDSIIHA